MQQKTSPWESMSEMRIILVMEMREGKIYPKLVLEGGFLHDNLFMKTYEPTRVMWSVPSLFSISTNNFISGMDSKGDSCSSMPCYWLISEIGKLFSACNGDFCSSGWLMNCLSDRQCLHKKKVCLVCNFLYSGFWTKRFSTAFAHFQHLVVEIDGFIAPLSLILEGCFTIHFKKEKKEGWNFFNR